jgi:hypothetical protein
LRMGPAPYLSDRQIQEALSILAAIVRAPADFPKEDRAP